MVTRVPTHFVFDHPPPPSDWKNSPPHKENMEYSKFEVHLEYVKIKLCHKSSNIGLILLQTGLLHAICGFLRVKSALTGKDRKVETAGLKHRLPVQSITGCMTNGFRKWAIVWPWDFGMAWPTLPRSACLGVGSIVRTRSSKSPRARQLPIFGNHLSCTR